MPNDIANLIEQLSEKMGEDADADVLIATLSAAWAEMAAKLSIAEGKLGVIGGEAAQSLQGLGSALDQLGEQISENDEVLAKLYADVSKKMKVGAQLEDQAQTVMKDVLKTYQEFDGNVSGLKKGIAGLAKSAIGSVVPGASSLLDSKIDNLLGIS